MDAASINAWFTPFHYFVYLGALFIIMIVYYQWKWSKTCKKNIQVLVSRESGGGDFILAPKSGGEITITNPLTNSTRTWAINELATIDVLYPGVGFVPAFLQKSIRMAIVSESDWEPLLNRSPHRNRVASPDMIIAIEDLIEDTEDEAVIRRLKYLIKDVSTAPTREMIASPEVLGNLINERITQAIMTVNKEIIDPIKNLVNRMNNLTNPWVVYIGLGLIIILLGFLAYQFMPVPDKINSMSNDINMIKQALGVP